MRDEGWLSVDSINNIKSISMPDREVGARVTLNSFSIEVKASRNRSDNAVGVSLANKPLPAHRAV